MPIIETEVWKANPERPGTVVFDSQRKAEDIFTELEAHLKADGRLPDEYFLFDSRGIWRDGALFPKDAEILCNVNYGGSEGIYLDIAVQYQKDVYGHSEENGVLGWHKRVVTEHFATGKTLGESIDDLDRMNLTASSVTAAFYGSKAEIKERYAKVERSEAAPVGSDDQIDHGGAEREEEIATGIAAKAAVTADTINGSVTRGDWVIVRPDEAYGCLVGQVTAVDKADSEAHDTDNPGDDIHVNFAALEYSDSAKADLLEALSGYFPDAGNFDALPPGDVIMAPESLISLTGLDFDGIDKLSASYKAAREFGNRVLAETFDGLEQQLIARVERNYSDYNKSLLSFGQRELIEMAAAIHAHSDAWSYMTSYHAYTDEELQFFMQFENPLEIVADKWRERNMDVGDLEFTVDFIMESERQKSALDAYPLVAATKPAANSVAESTTEPSKQAAKPKLPRAADAEPKPRSLMSQLDAATAEANERNAARTPQTQHKSKNKEID